MKVWTQRSVALLAAMGASLAFADFDGPAPVAWRWAQSTTASPAGAPQVMGNAVYVAVGGRMYGLDKATGNQLWRFPAAEPLEANFRTGGTIGQGLMVAAGDNKTVYAVDLATGTLKWQYLAPFAIVGSPVIVGNHVVVGMAPSSLVSLKAETGAPEWDKPLELKGDLYPNMSVFQDNVIVMTNTPTIVSVGAGSKKVNWTQSAGQLTGNAATVVYGDTVYVNSGYYLTALRGATGGKRWDRRVDKLLTYAPAVADSGVAVVTIDGTIYTFDINGNFMFKKGIDLDSSPVASPAFVGKLVAIGTENGILNVIDPKSGDVSFNYVIPPLFKGMRSSGGNGGSSGGGGKSGGLGLGGSSGGGGGGNESDDEIKYITVAGPAAYAGDTMLVLGKDGSLLAFDKKQGVDLTAPEVRMAWPNPGEQISGQPPLEMVFLIEDAASGVNPSTVAVTINGQEYAGVYTRDGYLSIKVSAVGANRPLMDGRAEVKISATDWMGNRVESVFNLSIDNTLPPSGAPPQNDKANGPGGGAKGGKGGGKGGGGVGGL